MERGITRKALIRRGVTGAVGMTAAGALLSACGGSGASSATSAGGKGSGTMNWLTWPDHYLPAQLAAVERKSGFGARPSLISDDSDGYLKARTMRGQYDMASADALWVNKYYDEGLAEAFDIKGLGMAKQLFPVALDVPFWRAGTNQMAFPFGWSSLQIYYNPKNVTTKPDSYHALLDPKYEGKIVLENQPTDLMAMAGIATGAKQPYDMTDAEIGQAKEFLKQLKPNVLKLVAQNPELVNLLADETAWLSISNLGVDVLVKKRKGPTLGVASASEGTYGWMDAEMKLKGGPEVDNFERYMDSLEQASFIAQNFLENGRPLFNEAAYKILVNQGHKELADRFYYNEPERPLSMTLKGPSKNEQAYIDAFNEVFAG